MMATPETVEKVARAICEAEARRNYGDNTGVAEVAWNNLTPYWRETWMDRARAALSTIDSENERLREALDARIEQCRKAVSECPNWSRAQAEWNRACDELLNLKDDLAALSSPPPAERR